MNLKVVLCQHLGAQAGLVTRGVMRRRNDSDCSGTKHFLAPCSNLYLHKIPNCI